MAEDAPAPEIPTGEEPSNEATAPEPSAATATEKEVTGTEGASDPVAEQAELSKEYAEAIEGTSTEPITTGNEPITTGTEPITTGEPITTVEPTTTGEPITTVDDNKAVSFEPAGTAEPPPAVEPAQQGDALDALVADDMTVPQEQDFPAPPMDSREMLRSPLSMSTPALGSYADLKAKTHFEGATKDGVLKRTTYLVAVSAYRTGPKYSLGIKTGSSLGVRSGANPAPGTYNVPQEDKTKYNKPPAFSFGAVARFGMGGEPPSKKQPGPGAYTPSDPALSCQPKVGFGTSVRGKGSLVAQANPGPGAYEQRSTVGNGPMVTACGRHATSYMRARSLPGPGAYNPSMHYAYPTLPRCGFGTSTRDDIGGRAKNLVQPGPGTYEMQNFRTVGTEAPKFSATSRRRVHDLNSYVTPGPGTYNAHATSFGY